MSSDRPCPEPTKYPVTSAMVMDGFRELARELMEVGADLSERAGQEAKTGNASTVDVASAFAHSSRAVRFSILLALRLGKPQPTPASEKSGLIRIASRALAIHEIEEAVRRAALQRWSAPGSEDDLDELEELEVEELEVEELEELEELEDIGDRPSAEVLADICRDLGLAVRPGAHPWKRRTRADVVGLCVRAAGHQAAGEVLPFPPRKRGR